MGDKYVYMIFDGDNNIRGTFTDRKAADIRLAWLFDNNPGKYFGIKKYKIDDEEIQNNTELYSNAVIHKGTSVFYIPYEERKYGTGNGWYIGSEFTSLMPIPDKSKIMESADKDPKFTEYKISFEITGDKTEQEIFDMGRKIYEKSNC